MTNKINSIKLLTLLLLSTVICAELFASEVNVYSGRKEKLIKPLLDEFSKETGVKVNLVTAKSSALLKRLELEAQSSPADIFITVDVGRLHHAKKIGLFQKIDKESLVNVKEAYLDKEGYWVGLSKRVRTIVVDKKITESEIKSFKDLTSSKFQNEICIRSSNNIYNQSMVASFIYHFGEKKTEKLMKKFVNNFARKPSGNDRAQIYSILKGECSIAVVNHYYYARLVKSNEEKNKENVGSSESQITIFTNRINRLTEHLKSNKKDENTRRGLMKLVGKRKKLLNYLKRKSNDKYESIIKSLGLRR